MTGQCEEGCAGGWGGNECNKGILKLFLHYFRLNIYISLMSVEWDSRRRYMAGMLLIRRKTLNNQSIYSIDQPSKEKSI